MYEITKGKVVIPEDLLADYLRRVNTPGGPQVDYKCKESDFRRMLDLGVDDFMLYTSSRTRSIAEHYQLLPKRRNLSTLKSALAVSRIGRWNKYRMLIFTPSDVYRVGHRDFGLLRLGLPNTLEMVSEKDPVFLGPGSNFAFVCC